MTYLNDVMLTWGLCQNTSLLLSNIPAKNRWGCKFSEMEWFLNMQIWVFLVVSFFLFHAYIVLNMDSFSLYSGIYRIQEMKRCQSSFWKRWLWRPLHKIKEQQKEALIDPLKIQERVTFVMTCWDEQDMIGTTHFWKKNNFYFVKISGYFVHLGLEINGIGFKPSSLFAC